MMLEDTADRLPTAGPVAEKGPALDLRPAAEAAAGTDVPVVNIDTTGLARGGAGLAGGHIPILELLSDLQEEDSLPPAITLDILLEVVATAGIFDLEAELVNTLLVILTMTRKPLLP